MANFPRTGVWPMLKQSIKMSLKNILGNKMRSFLTMLGVIIGVAAVIALVTTVSGVSDYMLDYFADMGAGSLTITANGTPLKSGLTENDLSEIRALENVKSISPSIAVYTNVVRGGNVSSDSKVTGKNEEFFVQNDLVTRGRPLLSTDMNGDVAVCVIDDSAAKKFFRGEDPLGKFVKIGGVQYEVVGVCEKDNNIMSALLSGSGDGTFYIPYRNALTLNGKNSVNNLEVYVLDTDRTDELVDRLENLLDNTFNDAKGAYSIFNMDSLLEMMNTMSDIMTNLLAGIASIALLVGGIGIMNMMLVSVTERTREIGLRKALGARPGLIQLQFLLESVFLSVLGGIFGIVLGETISYFATKLIGIDFQMKPSAIFLGFFFSLLVGVLFGWAPARRASKLNPIDALRSA